MKKISSENTKKGVLTVWQVETNGKTDFVTTLNDGTKSDSGVLEVAPTQSEAIHFARGVWKGIEMLS